VLHPVAHSPSGADLGIALSVAHAGMRYFANQLPAYNPHVAEQWSLLNYVRWAWAQGVRGMIQLSYFYGLLIWRLVQLWYLLIDRELDSQRHARHAERLRSLSTEWQIAEEKLVALDGLRRAPVTKRFWKLLSALFIDRVLLGALTLLLAAVLGARAHGWWRLAAPLGVIAAAAAVNQLLSRLRLESSASKLRAATQRIQQLVCAPFIVFGHSHSPERRALAGGAVYFNTGTWASDDAQHAFTHLVVTPAGGEAKPSAELRQWRDGLSAPYSS
jgi:hypothetical protein